MARYSISTLEKLSGVKAHTIRIWEQRYNLLNPQRTDTNIRFYDDNQLKKLLNIVTLLHNGHRISKVSLLTIDELNDKVSDLVENPRKDDGSVLAFANQLIAMGLTMDIDGFEEIFKKVRNEYNIEDTYVKVLQPMLIKIGLLWTKNKMNPAQEHFLSNLVRQKLLSATDALPLPKNKESRWMLFLPPDEHHEIGLLYAQFLLRKYNNTVLYLGANVPVKDIATIADSFQPTHALFFIVKRMTLRNGQKFVDEIQEALPDAKLMLSGNQNFIDKLNFTDRFTFLKDSEVFRSNYLHGNQET